jgi:hypothetical protein
LDFLKFHRLATACETYFISENRQELDALGKRKGLRGRLFDGKWFPGNYFPKFSVFVCH